MLTVDAVGGAFLFASRAFGWLGASVVAVSAGLLLVSVAVVGVDIVRTRRSRVSTVIGGEHRSGEPLRTPEVPMPEAPDDLLEELRHEVAVGREMVRWLTKAEENKRRMRGERPAAEMAEEWSLRVAALLEGHPLYREYFLADDREGLFPDVAGAMVAGPHAAQRRRLQTQIDHLEEVVTTMEGRPA